MRQAAQSPVWLRVGAPIALGLIVLLIWQVTTQAGLVPANLLPSPGAVVARLGEELTSGHILVYTGRTLIEAAAGSALAAVVGVPLGYLIARRRVADAALSPFIAASQAIPAIAVAPLLVIWIGYGLTPITLLCAWMVFFPVVLSTVLGLRTIDRDLIEAAALDGASGLAMITQIEAPLARRGVLTGLRTGFTLSITGAVVGEFVLGGDGLGMLLTVQSNSADTVGLFATLVVLACLAVTIYLSMIAIEKLTDPLHDRSLHSRRRP